MIKKFIYLFLFVFFIAACSSDDETPATDPTPNTPATGDVTNVEQKPTDIRSESAKSAQIETKMVNGKSMIQPGAAVSVDAKRRADILTGSGRQLTTTSSQRVKATDEDAAWLLDKVNGIDVSDDPDNDFVVFFFDDGEYEIYDISEDDWDWGYWYISDDGTVMAFDLDSDDEWVLKLDKLSPNQITLTDEAEELTYTWNAYVLGEGEQEDFIDDIEELGDMLEENVWMLDEVYFNDTLAPDVIKDLFMFFDTDGEYAYSAHFESDELPEVEGGDFTVDLDHFLFTFDEGTEDEEDLYLIYLDEDYLVLMQEDDGDILEFHFEAADLTQIPALMSVPDYWSVEKILREGEELTDDTHLSFTETTYKVYESDFDVVDSGTYVMDFNEFEYTSSIETDGESESGSGAVVFINDEFMVLFNDGDATTPDDLTIYEAGEFEEQSTVVITKE